MSTASWLGANLGDAIMDRLLSHRARRAQEARQAQQAQAPFVAAPSRSPDVFVERAAPAPIEQEVFAPALLTQTASAAARVEAFMDRFAYVRSDYARQWAGTERETGQPTYGWTRVGKLQPDNCALTPAVVEAHLRGRMTVGTYLLDADDTCRLLVLDHDDGRRLPDKTLVPEDGLAHLQDCRARLAQQGIDSAITESRRGGHLFVFLAEPLSGREARALAGLALGDEEVERMARGEDAFEVYPKQAARGERAGAVGSNIALPLGVHLKDGQRHPFIDRNGDAVARTLSGQLDYAAGIVRCQGREVLAARPWLREQWERATHPVLLRDQRPARGPSLSPPPPDHPRRDRVPGDSMIARWKAGVDTRDIVRAYGVDLDANGVGHCPWHDDRQASFQAWENGYTCYAGCGGGDALTFVMRQEDMSPKEALAYVRGRFPVAGMERAPTRGIAAER